MTRIVLWPSCTFHVGWALVGNSTPVTASCNTTAAEPDLRITKGFEERTSCQRAVPTTPEKFGSAGSPRVACPTSVPERPELYGEARPKPPTLRRRAPKNTKNPSGGWGRGFWTESGSLISVSKSIAPPPPDFEGT